MVLSTPLPLSAIKTDPAIRRFSEETEQNRPSVELLKAAKIQYQQQLLLACFDFQRLRAWLRRMAALLLGSSGVDPYFRTGPIRALEKRTEDEVCTVGDNFIRQLRGLFSTDSLPASDAPVVERISKASVYFKEKIAPGLGRQIPDLQIDTDNNALRKKVNNALKRLREEIEVKLAAVQCCGHGFSPANYFQAVSAAGIDAGKKKEKVVDHLWRSRYRPS